MSLSVFDIFKIGIGPSSSHTMGPMVAMKRFYDALRDPETRVPGAGEVAALQVRLFGSLAFTGKGHATDQAVIFGALGFTPDRFDREAANAALDELRLSKKLTPQDLPTLNFDPDIDVVFDYETKAERHANAMRCAAFDATGQLYASIDYFSVGGGFVVTASEYDAPNDGGEGVQLPYSFRNADELVALTRETGKSIAEIMRANELAMRDKESLDKGIARIWQVMRDCMDRGLTHEGVLPGGLGVRRRAAAIHNALKLEFGQNAFPPHIINDWISTYAMAVNEENAAGGQVVTSPTNGAAGVVPAVIRYYLEHVPGASEKHVADFLLTAAAIGGIVKRNASISGAECGCQAEVGSAAAMAAAGLAAVLGARPEQIENAAEIALEHHLGMTCDPVKGLVQVPCIERNGLGAIKAVSAASLALRGDGVHLVSLDNCIETMRQTGRDMDHRYKETSLGGLAVNLPEC